MHFSGRPGAAHAHAHERQLAHLPSRRALAAPAPRHARSSSRPRTSRRSASTCRSRSSSTGGRWRGTTICARSGPDLLGDDVRRGRGAARGSASARGDGDRRRAAQSARRRRHRQRLQVRSAVPLRRQSVRAGPRRRATSSLREILATARKHLQANVTRSAGRHHDLPRLSRAAAGATTSERRYVYGRARKPCRSCGRRSTCRRRGRTRGSPTGARPARPESAHFFQRAQRRGAGDLAPALRRERGGAGRPPRCAAEPAERGRVRIARDGSTRRARMAIRSVGARQRLQSGPRTSVSSGSSNGFFPVADETAAPRVDVIASRARPRSRRVKFSHIAPPPPNAAVACRRAPAPRRRPALFRPQPHACTMQALMLARASIVAGSLK